MTYTDLPSIVQALVAAPRAWLTPSQLAKFLGEEEGNVIDALCELDLAGHIKVFEVNDEINVSLSLRAIEKLDLELIESGEGFRWSRIPRPKRAVAPDDANVDQAVDPVLGPVETAVYREEFARLQFRRQERRIRRGLALRPQDVAFPTIFLTGHPLWAWREKDEGKRPSTFCQHCVRGKKKKKIIKSQCDHCGRNARSAPRFDVCTCCQDRELGQDVYCGKCRRWGWDDYFKPPATKPVEEHADARPTEAATSQSDHRRRA